MAAALEETSFERPNDKENMRHPFLVTPSDTSVGYGVAGGSERGLPGGHNHWGLHMSIARRELDDDLVVRLDELAAQLGTNRSELLRRGATAVITAEELATADRELIAGYQRQPPDPALVQSARRLAARTAPPW